MFIPIEVFTKFTIMTILTSMSTLCSHIFAVFPLFAPYGINKCEIGNHWVQEYYILRLQISLILFFSQDTAKIKLAILSILYSSEFVKTSNVKNPELR